MPYIVIALEMATEYNFPYRLQTVPNTHIHRRARHRQPSQALNNTDDDRFLLSRGRTLRHTDEALVSGRQHVAQVAFVDSKWVGENWCQGMPSCGQVHASY